MSANRPFRRLLVGWDASRDAAAALQAAVAIAGEGHVVALAVLPPAGHAETASERAANEKAAGERVRAPFDRLHAELAAPAGARVSLQLAQDRHVARVLCGYAAEHGFDLLVLGRHGEGGVAGGKLGRVADAAVRSATIPVLLMSAPWARAA